MSQASETLDLSITIAAYREAESLALLLPAVHEAAAALTPSFEILIVDTQQPMDATEQLCEQLRPLGVRFVRRSGGNAYGDALRTIIREARGQFLLNLDADGSHSPACFAPMWAQRTNADIVIGSRYAPGGHTENPLVLIWMSYAVNLVFRLAFSLHARDVTNSLRLYRRDILTSMRLVSDDFDVLEEVLIKSTLRRPPARIVEVPVTFSRRQAGESKRKLMKFALGYLKTLRRLRTLSREAKLQQEAQP